MLFFCLFICSFLFVLFVCCVCFCVRVCVCGGGEGGGVVWCCFLVFAVCFLLENLYITNVGEYI